MSHPFIEIGLKKVLPAVLLNKLAFFGIYKYTDNPGVVDVAWTIGHLVVGGVYASHFNALQSSCGQIMFGLLSLWAVRLAGHLFYHRIYQG